MRERTGRSPASAAFAIPAPHAPTARPSRPRRPGRAPADPRTFERCRLRDDERAGHRTWRALHGDLLRLRRESAAFAAQRADVVDGAVLATGCFTLRYAMDEPDEDRLLIVNLGRDRELVPAPEPLLAPPAGREWRLAWSSEDPRYGGRGTPEPETAEGWRIPGPAAVVLAPRPPSADSAAPAEEIA